MRAVDRAALLFEKLFVDSVVRHGNVDGWSWIHRLLSQDSASVFGDD